jgi:hypothetical protein
MSFVSTVFSFLLLGSKRLLEYQAVEQGMLLLNNHPLPALTPNRQGLCACAGRLNLFVSVLAHPNLLHAAGIRLHHFSPTPKQQSKPCCSSTTNPQR